MRAGDFGHGRHRTVRLHAGFVYKERPWLHCDVLAHQPPNVSSKFTHLRMFFCSHTFAQCARNNRVKITHPACVCVCYQLCDNRGLCTTPRERHTHTHAHSRCRTKPLMFAHEQRQHAKQICWHCRQSRRK